MDGEKKEPVDGSRQKKVEDGGSLPSRPALFTRPTSSTTTATNEYFSSTYEYCECDKCV